MDGWTEKNGGRMEGETDGGTEGWVMDRGRHGEKAVWMEGGGVHTICPGRAEGQGCRQTDRQTDACPRARRTRCPCTHQQVLPVPGWPFCSCSVPSRRGGWVHPSPWGTWPARAGGHTAGNTVRHWGVPAARGPGAGEGPPRVPRRSPKWLDAACIIYLFDAHRKCRADGKRHFPHLSRLAVTAARHGAGSHRSKPDPGWGEPWALPAPTCWSPSSLALTRPVLAPGPQPRRLPSPAPQGTPPPLPPAPQPQRGAGGGPAPGVPGTCR